MVGAVVVPAVVAGAVGTGAVVGGTVAGSVGVVSTVVVGGEGVVIDWCAVAPATVKAANRPANATAAAAKMRSALLMTGWNDGLDLPR